MDKNNTFIAFFRLLHKRGFVMAAFFWTFFVNTSANTYEKSATDIPVSDTESQVSVDIYFSKKTLIQLEKIRRGCAKEKTSVEHKIQRNRTGRNEYQKLFIFGFPFLDRKSSLLLTQKNTQDNTDTVFTTTVLDYNVNHTRSFVRKNTKKYVYSSFFFDKDFIRYLFSLPPP